MYHQCSARHDIECTLWYSSVYGIKMCIYCKKKTFLDRKPENLLVLCIAFKALTHTLFLLTVNLFYNGKEESTPWWKHQRYKNCGGRHQPPASARCKLQSSVDSLNNHSSQNLCFKIQLTTRCATLNHKILYPLKLHQSGLHSQLFKVQTIFRIKPLRYHFLSYNL